MLQTNWKLDHSAHAVFDLDAGIALYQQLGGLKLTHREIVQDQLVEVAFLDCGNSKIELISPTDKSSSVQKFLDKYGEGLHHICFAVQNLDSELKRLESESIRLVDSVARSGAAGKSIAFLHPKSCQGVLIELCQSGA